MESHPPKFLFKNRSKFRNFCQSCSLESISQGRVLFCIDAKFCKKICVGKFSPRSTQCTPSHRSSLTQNLSQTSEKRKMLSNAYLLFSISLQKFVLIQPRTSPPNICKILQKKNYQNLIANLIVILLIRTSKPISPDSSTSPQVPAHDRPPQQLLRPGARARRGGGPGRGRAGAAKDTNE